MFSKNLSLNYFFSNIFLAFLFLNTSNLFSQINCDNYSNRIFELIKHKDFSKVDKYLRPAEQSLKIVHWDSTAENIELFELANKALKDSIVESIVNIHQTFASKGVKLIDAEFKNCEFDRNKSELLIFFTFDKRQYWVKVFSDYFYLEDRFKSQFDSTLTMTEKFNQRIVRTESKPLEPISLSAERLKVLQTCYGKNEIETYGKLKGLLVISEQQLESGIIEIVAMCNSDKCRGKPILFHLNLSDETCKIILE